MHIIFYISFNLKIMKVTLTKKPVQVEAVLWDGSNINEVLGFMKWMHADHDDKNGLFINTLEGKIKADIGDYIIKGVKGDFYPCKPDITAMAYDFPARHFECVLIEQSLETSEKDGQIFVSVGMEIQSVGDFKDFEDDENALKMLLARKIMTNKIYI